MHLGSQPKTRCHALRHQNYSSNFQKFTPPAETRTTNHLELRVCFDVVYGFELTAAWHRRGNLTNPWEYYRMVLAGCDLADALLANAPARDWRSVFTDLKECDCLLRENCRKRPHRNFYRGFPYKKAHQPDCTFLATFRIPITQKIRESCFRARWMPRYLQRETASDSSSECIWGVGSAARLTTKYLLNRFLLPIGK